MSKNLVVVTGASGYIGSHIVANLLSKGRNVRATVRDMGDPERIQHLNNLPIEKNGSLEIVEMDLLNEESVNIAISGCEDVIHTAAAVIIKSKEPQKEIVDPSVIGTRNVLNAIEKNGKVINFIHTSSTAAIRPTKWENGTILTSETFAEDATLDKNPYGLAKYSAEMLVRKWHKNIKSGPRMITIHPCMVFGPAMSKRHLHGSLSILMMLVKRKLPVLLPMQISIVDVRDVAEFDGPLGHIEGAVLLPLDRLECETQSLSTEVPIILVCRSGSRSARATLMLRKLGFKQVANLAGGMLRWHALTNWSDWSI